MNLYNPTKAEKVIFTIFDWVHLFKNIRNNFANQQKLKFYSWDDPKVEKFAEWQHLETVYNKEKDQTVRLAHKLSQAAIYPSNFVR